MVHSAVMSPVATLFLSVRPPLKIGGKLRFSAQTNQTTFLFNKFPLNLRPRAYLPHGRRRVAQQTPPQEDETAPLPAVRKFPARGKRWTRLCSFLPPFRVSDPRVQNFPPTRRDDSGDVVNSGLMIVTRSRFCFCMMCERCIEAAVGEREGGMALKCDHMLGSGSGARSAPLHSWSRSVWSLFFLASSHSTTAK